MALKNTPKGKKKKTSGAVSASGKTGLSFKPGTSQHTSITKKKTRTARLSDKAPAKKTGSERQQGETARGYLKRRDAARALLKKKKK